MTNDELSQIVSTSDEWIRSRTGIRARRIAGPRETTASLAEQRRTRRLRPPTFTPRTLTS